MLDAYKDGCRGAFESTNSPAQRKPRATTSPISLRLSPDERAKLERSAGQETLSRYIRKRLFGDGIAEPHSRRPVRKGHLPPADMVLLARFLGVLGESQIATNLTQIADAAKAGALPVTDDLVDELRASCAEVHEMRNALIQALAGACR